MDFNQSHGYYPKLIEEQPATEIVQRPVEARPVEATVVPQQVPIQLHLMIKIEVSIGTITVR